MSHDLDTREIRFAHRVRQALEASSSDLPPGVATRLAEARRLAMTKKKPEHQTVLQPALAYAGMVGLSSGEHAPRRGLFEKLSRLGLLWPLAALIVGLAGVAYWEHRQHIEDLADIDAAVLSDDLPLSAYADHGFKAYLKHAQ